VIFSDCPNIVIYATNKSRLLYISYPKGESNIKNVQQNTCSVINTLTYVYTVSGINCFSTLNEF